MMIRIVIIEDRILTLKALQQTVPWTDNNIEPIGFFDSCEQALPFILAEKPDVVITDIVMHGLSGIGLCEKIREAGLKTKLIIVSAYSKFEYAQRALQLGVYDYFEKPVDFAALIAAVRKAGEAYQRELQAASVLQYAEAAMRTAKSGENPADLDERERMLQKMVDYLHEHYTESSFNLDDMARYVGMSPNYMSTYFKKEKGYGIKEYVTKLRIILACQLLETTDMSIGMIGESVGYSSLFYFSDAFKRHLKCSPSEYRKINRRRDENA